MLLLTLKLRMGDWQCTTQVWPLLQPRRELRVLNHQELFHLQELDLPPGQQGFPLVLHPVAMDQRCNLVHISTMLLPNTAF